jgi:hypothetical protein
VVSYQSLCCQRVLSAVLYCCINSVIRGICRSLIQHSHFKFILGAPLGVRVKTKCRFQEALLSKISSWKWQITTEVIAYRSIYRKISTIYNKQAESHNLTQHHYEFTERPTSIQPVENATGRFILKCLTQTTWKVFKNTATLRWNTATCCNSSHRLCPSPHCGTSSYHYIMASLDIGAIGIGSRLQYRLNHRNLCHCSLAANPVTPTTSLLGTS